MTHIEALKHAKLILEDNLQYRRVFPEATKAALDKVNEAIDTALKSAEQDEWSPPLRPKGTQAGKDFTFGFNTSEPVGVDKWTLHDVTMMLTRRIFIHGWDDSPTAEAKWEKDFLISQGADWEKLIANSKPMMREATPNQVKVSVDERRSPHDRQKWAETIARYFAGYSFSRHESAQCFGLVDVLIANGVSFPTPPAQAEEK